MKRALVSIFAAAAFFVAGDVRAQSYADTVEKAVQILERIANAVDANQNDCNAMGDKLTVIVDQNAAFLAQAKARSEQLTPRARNAIEARFRDRILAAISKMRPGMMKCGSNPKVSAALARVNPT